MYILGRHHHISHIFELLIDQRNLYVKALEVCQVSLLVIQLRREYIPHITIDSLQLILSFLKLSQLYRQTIL